MYWWIFSSIFMFSSFKHPEILIFLNSSNVLFSFSLFSAVFLARFSSFLIHFFNFCNISSVSFHFFPQFCPWKSTKLLLKTSFSKLDFTKLTPGLIFRWLIEAEAGRHIKWLMFCKRPARSLLVHYVALSRDPFRTKAAGERDVRVFKRTF